MKILLGYFRKLIAIYRFVTKQTHGVDCEFVNNYITQLMYIASVRSDNFAKLRVPF